jgi:hypothetical protein
MGIGEGKKPVNRRDKMILEALSRALYDFRNVGEHVTLDLTPE